MSGEHQFSQYSEQVIEHFRNPRNLGEIEAADGKGEVGNAKCGDMMQLFIKVENHKIKDAKFKTFGCCAAIATSSMLTEMIKGRSLTELLAVTNEAICQALGGLPKTKLHCSVLAEDALKAALQDYHQKAQGKNNDKTHQF